MRSLLVGSLVTLLPALASAESTAVRQLKAPGTASYGDIVAGPSTINDLQFARQYLPGTGTPGVTALAQSKIVYLNKNGVTLQPGNNDARTNRSTLATQATTIPAWNVAPATWTATVNCMKELFAPFDVTITETDPGAAQHIEAVFGGSPGQLGMPNGVAGVSPFTSDCSVIENSIVFTFTNVIPADARLACEIMAQEVAHSYGLDHELLASDPMTYLDYTGNRSFKNQTASCGEDVTRPCGINGSTCRANQNSVALLTERLGAKTGDTTPPTGTIASPAANTTVPPGFSVYVNAADNIAVAGAKLFVDGTQADMKTGAGPFTFTTAATLSEGLHKLKVEVSDAGNNVVTTQEVTVTVKKGAAPPPAPGGGTDPAGDDSSEITGGCAAGGSGGGLALGLAMFGLAFTTRRRRS
ncbi:MAG: hypothetical protein IPQ07_38295 [Myxococcales bacterium]|nr:hypothetical protein [Myxococcales bacterium]